MSARLIQFVLNETARACVEQCPQNHIDGEFDQETYDEQTQLNQNSPALAGLPNGVYSVFIEADPLHNPMARFSLLETEGPHAIAMVEIDLRPFMVSAIAYGDEYEDVDEENFTDIENKILLERASALEGMFEPYIKNNAVFNLRLLDMIDYLTYPAILTKISAYNLEAALEPNGSQAIVNSRMKLN